MSCTCGTCKKCRKRAHDKAWREKNREHKVATDRAYNAENHERILAYSRTWYAKNRERILAYSKARYAKNRERILAYAKDWHAANPEKARRNSLKRYGITPEEYHKLLESQSGGCAICGSTDSKRKGSRYLFVDHCHDTGKIRGLLCNTCNVGVGQLPTSAACRSAADYLEKDNHDQETLWLAVTAGCFMC